ncbi:MAG: hypothetical protein AAF657_16635 [Acidobacteriota bacterium]
MRKSPLWVAFGWLCLGSASQAHELTFSGKFFAPADVSDVCIGNLNGIDDDDVRRVDLRDFVILSESFGEPCPEPWETEHCPEDLNHNHEIGPGDREVLMANWGRCRYRADVDGDGDVDPEDARVVLTDLGLDCRPDLDWNDRIEGRDLHLAQIAWEPGEDLQGDVDGDGLLEIGEDLMAVLESLDIGCEADVDLNRAVDCADLDEICGRETVDCCELDLTACPEVEAEEACSEPET